ncbi:hypothetical protein B0H13DRAFT_1879540 [Mycena leptocephala]|nr:hypothetical protein B0H13DRAFT_1879540 [Mycena leptocephala]
MHLKGCEFHLMDFQTRAQVHAYSTLSCYVNHVPYATTDFAGNDRSSSTDEHFPEELMDAFDGEIPQIVVETSGDDSEYKENAHIVAGVKRKAEDFADEGAERRPRQRIVKPTHLNL